MISTSPSTSQSTTTNTTTADAGATGSARSASAARGHHAPRHARDVDTSKIANTSAANIIPEGQSAIEIDDPIYGQPSAPVMSRAQRAERDAVLRRRLSPEQYDAAQERFAAEEAAQQQSQQQGQ